MMYTARNKELQLRIFTDHDKLNSMVIVAAAKQVQYVLLLFFFDTGLEDLLLAGHSSLHDMGEEDGGPESTADESGGSGGSKRKAATSPPSTQRRKRSRMQQVKGKGKQLYNASDPSGPDATTTETDAGPAVSWRVPHDGSRTVGTSEEIETDVDMTTDEPREPLVVVSGATMEVDSK